MTTEMNGPVTDSRPPLAGKKHKWKFKNETGEEICDLWLVTGPNAIGADSPDIKKVVVKNSEGEKVYDQIVNEEETWHATGFSKCIKPDENFSVTAEFDDEFEEKDWIQFSPTDEDGATIIDEFRPGEAKPGGLDLLDLLREILKFLPDILTRLEQRGKTLKEEASYSVTGKKTR